MEITTINSSVKNELKKYLKEVASLFSCQIHQISLNISLSKVTRFTDKITVNIFYHPLKRLIFDQYLLKTESF
jgi:hypothetical protein